MTEFTPEMLTTNPTFHHPQNHEPFATPPIHNPAASFHRAVRTWEAAIRRVTLNIPERASFRFPPHRPNKGPAMSTNPRSARFLRVIYLAASCLTCGLWPDSARAAEIDFARDILPILSDACFHCHGPDEVGRKGNLRLDTESGAFADLGDRAAIVPGKPDDSELVIRVFETDPAAIMPPPSLNRPLSQKQKELLRDWVAQGAKWGGHWAFRPMSKKAPPAVKNEAWIRQPIDRFVLAGLEAQGLAPAPEAPREVWLRRVTFDLTGLPPTPEELAAFLADVSPRAYEKVVDRLFASPRYGERMATDWLDVARYADTHGYQMDRYRPVWPYRDWVISAFNRNLPFDDFARWQIAGDLLPDASQEQRLATAFNRLHMQNEEGGIVAEEFRVAYVVDRVNTMGTAFLGMTFECSRCHDHKYDPVSQRDFYSLASFFSNIDEYGQTTYFTSSTPVPALLLTRPEQDAELARLASAITTAEQTVAARMAESRAAFQTWLPSRGTDLPARGPVARFTFDELTSGKLANAVQADHPLSPADNPQFTAGRDGAGQAASLSGDNGFSGAAPLAAFSRTTPFSFSLWLKPAQHSERQVVFHKSMAPADAGSRGYELILEDGRLAFGLHHMWPGNSIKIVSRGKLATGDWSHVAITYDGSSRAAGLRLFLNGAPLDVEVIRDKLTKDITYEQGPPPFQIGYRFRDMGYKGGQIDDLAIFNRALSPLEALDLAGKPGFAAAWKTSDSELTPAQSDALFDYFVREVHTPTKEALAALQAARDAQSKLINPIPEIMVMQELPQPRKTFILKRGAYDAPGDEVTAGTPAAMPPFPEKLPRNRLGLAAWLLDPEHPLTARVTVNRFWQQLFGRGLVATSDNFGTQGAFPSHPELLDWLARDFIASGWDVQHVLRELVLSSTYRQSSKASHDLLARDPENLLLARGPSRRLSAEQLRDQALVTSGLLVEKVGGPSVKPYQPDGLWDVAMGRPRYDQGKGDDLYRRSLYTFWKRTVPPPAMVAFDAAERNVCIVRRQSTSTPLQALALLNDVQIVEAARFLGERFVTDKDRTPADRIAALFTRVTARAPRQRELELLRELYDEQLALFRSKPEAAKKLLAVGEKPNTTGLDPIELAAATVLAQAALDLDAAIMLR